MSSPDRSRGTRWLSPSHLARRIRSLPRSDCTHVPAGEWSPPRPPSTYLSPDVRLNGGAGLVETRFLESADALLLIAINHADTPQRVTMTFTPDVPEAIWQNMETGASINFVAGASGPTYTYAFAPRDVVVLMIRRKYR